MALELITYIAQNLVADLDSLSVTSNRKGHILNVEIRCAKEDAGRIIGKNGRIINSIRTLARAAAEGRERIDVNLID